MFAGGRPSSFVEYPGDLAQVRFADGSAPELPKIVSIANFGAWRCRDLASVGTRSFWRACSFREQVRLRGFHSVCDVRPIEMTGFSGEIADARVWETRVGGVRYFQPRKLEAPCRAIPREECG